jgi:hypothetical protein
MNQEKWHLWIVYINLQAWLCKSTPFSSIRKQDYSTIHKTDMNLQQCSLATEGYIMRLCTPAAYKHTSFAPKGHSQRTKLNSATWKTYYVQWRWWVFLTTNRDCWTTTNLILGSCSSLCKMAGLQGLCKCCIPRSECVNKPNIFIFEDSPYTHQGTNDHREQDEPYDNYVNEQVKKSRKCEYR